MTDRSGTEPLAPSADATSDLILDPGLDDATLAGGVVRCLDLDLPDACVAGVAMNARLLRHHWNILREGTR